jgi:hypothetical protein
VRGSPTLGGVGLRSRRRTEPMVRAFAEDFALFSFSTARCSFLP